MAQIEELRAIEGIASDVRQARITTVVSDGRTLSSLSLYLSVRLASVNY